MKQLAVITVLLGMVINFQNCSRFGSEDDGLGKAKKVSYSTLYGGSGGEALQPASDRFDDKCLSSSAYHACLFKKNPVAAAGKSISGITLNDLSTHQTYGVKLTGMYDTGILENDTIRVESVKNIKIDTSKVLTKYQASGSEATRFMMLQTYYWLNRTVEHLHLRTSSLPAKGKGIKVYVDDTVNGWAPRTNSLHLRKDDRGTQQGLSAEVAVFEFGAANLYHATGGRLSHSPSQHRECNNNRFGCCTGALGCSKAIESGVGDYFVGIVFPDRTAFGETLVNDINGISRCGIFRNLANTTTVAAANSACTNAVGEVVLLGSVYAATWWTIRKKSGRETEIDTLFLKHLSQIDGNDTFRSALAKAKTLDAQLNSARNASLFDEQIAARGL